jgi:hypothetical protein
MYPFGELARAWAAFWCIIFGLSLPLIPSGAGYFAASIASFGMTYLWFAYVVPRLRGGPPKVDPILLSTL